MTTKITKVLALLCAVIMLFTLAGCGEVSRAESSVRKMFSSLKSGNAEALQKCTDWELDSSDDLIQSEGDSEPYKIYMDKLSYKIESSEKINDNTILVKVQITTIDMKPVMTTILKEAVGLTLDALGGSSEEELEAKLDKIMIDALQDENLKMITVPVELTVIKEENGWVIQTNMKLVNALAGGSLDLFEQLEGLFS